MEILRQRPEDGMRMQKSEDEAQMKNGIRSVGKTELILGDGL